MRKFKIRDSMWGQDITIITKCSQEDVGKMVMKKHGIKLNNDNVLDACYFFVDDQKGKRKRIIHIDKFDWSVISQGLLVHEMLHLVFDVLGEHGIKHGSGTSEECFTYYIQHLMTDALWKMRKLK